MNSFLLHNTKPDPVFKDKAIFIEHIGQGAQGVVNKYRLRTGNFVAVKKIIPNDFDQDDITDTTLHELHALKVLSGCEGIIQLLDIEIDDNFIFSIMLSYHKSDLEMFIKEVPFIERLRYVDIITSQLLKALSQLNNRGIVHGDIKPKNILIDYKYDKITNQLIESPTIYLSDFGSSHQLSCNKNYRPSGFRLIGYTDAYSPPESNLHGNIYSDKSDVYALGMTLLTYYIGKNFKELHDNNFSIDDDISVRIIMKSLMSTFHYELIPEKNIVLLNTMLIKDIDNRTHITELTSDNSYCKIIDTALYRGELHIDSEVSTLDYYDIIKILIKASESFKLLVRTCIVAIDLSDRYLANYPVKIDEFKLIGYVCLFLACKTVEIYSPEINDFIWISGDIFTVNDIKNTQIIILQRCDYIILTCDIDLYVFVYLKNMNKDKFNNLYTIYDLIEANNLYAGALTYYQIINYIKSTY